LICCTIYHRDMSSEYSKAKIILELYKIFDSHRDSRLWVLDELDVKTAMKIFKRYKGHTIEQSRFTAVCSFFELLGVF
jgi:hypothetical protein